MSPGVAAPRTAASVALVAAVTVAGAVATSACAKRREQSFHDAVAILCVTDEEAGVARLDPAQRNGARSAWIAARLRNPQVRDAFEQLGRLGPAERARLLHELTDRAGLAGCGGPRSNLMVAGVALPVVAGTGAADLSDTPAIAVIVREHTLLVDGTEVIALPDGQPDPSELEGGVQGLVMPRLRAYVARAVVRTGAPPVEAALLGLPADATFRLLVQVMSSVKPSVTRFELLAAGPDGALAAIPIALPQRVAVAATVEAEPRRSVGLVVAATRDRVIVFSLSGTEGTLKDPKLVVTGTAADQLARVRATLADIVARNPEDRSLIVMFDRTTPMQQVVDVLAAARATDDGRPLYTELRLSVGFQ